MTTWSIEYGDEAGNQNTRTTDDIGEVHATLDMLEVPESEREGYAGQTARFHGFDERDPATGHGRGNWSLYVTNLDTHTEDGYEIDDEPWALDTDGETMEEAEPIMATLAPIADRQVILANMVAGLAGLHTARPNLHIEWSGGTDDPVTVRETNGWTLTLATWELHLFDHTADITIVPNGDIGAGITLPSMDALVYMHNALMRSEYLERNGL